MVFNTPPARYLRSIVAEAVERSEATSPPSPSSAARTCLVRVSLSSAAQNVRRLRHSRMALPCPSACAATAFVYRVRAAASS
jgi:hypothetical protein